MLAIRRLFPQKLTSKLAPVLQNAAKTGAIRANLPGSTREGLPETVLNRNHWPSGTTVWIATLPSGSVNLRYLSAISQRCVEARAADVAILLPSGDQPRCERLHRRPVAVNPREET